MGECTYKYPREPSSLSSSCLPSLLYLISFFLAASELSRSRFVEFSLFQILVDTSSRHGPVKFSMKREGMLRQRAQPPQPTRWTDRLNNPAAFQRPDVRNAGMTNPYSFYSGGFHSGGSMQRQQAQRAQQTQNARTPGWEHHPQTSWNMRGQRNADQAVNNRRPSNMHPGPAGPHVYQYTHLNLRHGGSGRPITVSRFPGQREAFGRTPRRYDNFGGDFASAPWFSPWGDEELLYSSDEDLQQRRCGRRGRSTCNSSSDADTTWERVRRRQPAFAHDDDDDDALSWTRERSNHNARWFNPWW